jgi:serine protease AprX
MGTNNTGAAPGNNRLIAKIISIAGQASADDDNGHGTWVGGIVGGRGWGGSGTSDDANYVGIAPNVNLIGVKVSDATGQSYVSNVISGLQWVVDNQSAYIIRREPVTRVFVCGVVQDE